MKPVLIGVGVLLAFFGYFLWGTRIVDRVEVGLVVDEVVRIRDGEVVFRERFGRYGTLEELVRERLVSGDVADGEAWGFEFELAAGRSGYQLRVREVLTGDEVRERLSFFVDESGVIRGSVDAGRLADSGSERVF